MVIDSVGVEGSELLGVGGGDFVEVVQRVKVGVCEKVECWDAEG